VHLDIGSCFNKINFILPSQVSTTCVCCSDSTCSHAHQPRALNVCICCWPRRFFVWLPFVGCWENSKFGPCLNRNPRRHSQGIPRKNGFDRVGNECVRENAPPDVKTRTVLLLCDVETSTLALGRAATLYAKAYACALIADYYFETLLMWHGNFWFCLNTRFQLSKYVYCGPKNTVQP
jgi:hypothetical protein